jgi:hypothetical protein
LVFAMGGLVLSGLLIIGTGLVGGRSIIGFLRAVVHTSILLLQGRDLRFLRR